MLLALIILIGIGYIVALLLGFQPGKLAQPDITTSPMNSTITYAGASITVLDAQRSQTFVDDPRASPSGMIRLHLRAQNNTQVPVDLPYSSITSLVLPDQHVVAPLFVKSNVDLAPGNTQTSAVDFAVPVSMKTDQLLLRLGSVNDAQMDIPLTHQADTSKYAPISTKISGHASYLGLNWTLMRVTSQWSIAGQQASRGMRYMTVTLTVDNTLSQVAIPGSPFDYLRLKAGNTLVTPVASTLPVSYTAGAMGKTGTATFLVPQNAKSLTLILLAQSGFTQTTVDFTV